MNRKKIVSHWRGLTTACLLAFGATVFGIGTASLGAQILSPSPIDTCEDEGGSLCIKGKTCFFFCWGWEKYWPEEPAPLTPTFAY